MTFFSGQLGNRVGASVGRFFFDRERVIRSLDRGEKNRLSKAGAFVRRRSRSSIRKARRKRESELDPQERIAYYAAVDRAQREGRAKPRIWWFAHSKPGEPPRSIWGLLRDHIYFVYDPSRRSVVVGPAKLNGTSGSAPQALEFGGYVTSQRLGRQVYIEPRPYMRPALDAEIDNFPELYRNSME